MSTALLLENERVRLQPLQPGDFTSLLSIATDPAIWQFTPSLVYDASSLSRWMNRAFEARATGQREPFLIWDKEQDRAAGSTSLANYSARDQRVEIGYTWLGRAFQGTGINQMAKALLLVHAFESMKCKRVELKTDVLNQQSRRAMEKIGAREEGVLRSHTLMHDGRRRDTIFYSILETEWPEVKARLVL
ncbi:MAG: GNAT family protein [Bacteroidota bacterium]